MSSCARVIIGMACGFSAIIFTLLAFGTSPAENPWVPGILAVMCYAVCATCIPGKHVKVTSRIIGGVGLFFSIAYIVAEILSPTPQRGHSDPNLWYAILFFLVWGIPSGFVMIYGFYPKWGEIGHELGRDLKTTENEEGESEDEHTLDRYQR